MSPSYQQDAGACLKEALPVNQSNGGSDRLGQSNCISLFHWANQILFPVYICKTFLYKQLHRSNQSVALGWLLGKVGKELKGNKKELKRLSQRNLVKH